MTKKRTLPGGWIAYQLDHEEMRSIQNFEIAMEGCITCKCEVNDVVYYVPIMDAWVYEKCIEE